MNIQCPSIPSYRQQQEKKNSEPDNNYNMCFVYTDDDKSV
jgi:hypothetical protein